MIRNQLCTIFLTTFLFFTSFAFSQVIFSEDFDGIPGPTAGGAGTYSFPQGWLLRNVDNRTPTANVSYVNDAWERREDFSFNVIDSAAFSTSWYSPAGSADDWMWTPEITLPATGNNLLKWNALAYDLDFSDGYEVRIMVSPNVPTGGSGVIGNQVTNSTVLFSTAGENSTWTAREVNLSAYNGQTFRIAYRNNSNDKFLLLIDDVQVVTINNFDLAMTAFQEFEYTKLPLTQSAATPLGATVRNDGALPLTNFNLKASIYNGSNVLIETIYSDNIPALTSGASISPQFPDWNPSQVDVYSIIYEPNTTETDPTPENNSITANIDITDEVFARDNGDVVGSLGIGAGNGGYLGQSFTIQQETYANSATISYTRGYTGKNYQLALWNTDGGGNPDTLIAETELKTYLNDDALTDTLSFENGPVPLLPGRYVITAVEIDSTLAVAQTSKQFTPGTTFVDWPTNPFGDWANNEDFGGSFAKSYAIRLNLRDNLIEPDANNILYVDKNVSGGDQIGNSWANAIPELADALKWAKQNESNWTEQDPLQIWVADGTYLPLYSPADNNFGNDDGRQNSFLIVKDVQLYGGFDSGETALTERNWSANPTILSAEIQNDNVHDNNAYHVMVAAGDSGSTVIDGFTIENGYAADDAGGSQFIANGLVFQNRLSGGIIGVETDLTINNCTFHNNQGYGASAIRNSGGLLTIQNSLFYENNNPEGLFAYVIYSEASATLTNVTMSKNSGTQMVGGNLVNVNNSIFWGNTIFAELDAVNVQNSIIEDLEETSENFDIDPLFTDADNNDFTLQTCSKGVNSGDNSLFININENSLDLAGNSRVFDFNDGGIIDMGAYEFQDVQVDYSLVTFEDLTVTYDGNEHSIEVQNIPLGISVSYEITNDEDETTQGNSATIAGVYTIEATLSGCGEPVMYNTTLTINKAEAIITADDVQTHTYDGTVKNVVASLNHNETTLVYSPQQGYTDVGTYEIEISAAESQNYLAASKEVELIIENADFDGIEFEDDEFTYDGIAHSIFISGEPAEATVTYTNNAQTNAGTYTVSALIEMPNFNDLELTATLTINKAESIITADEVQIHTYDGTVKNVVASLNHNETTLVYSPQQGYTDVGTYEIEISAAESQNYLAASKEVELIIENADFDGIEFEDDEFTYDGTAHSIFISGEPAEATVTYTNNGQTNAGIYTITALIEMDNFEDLELTATLTINKAESIITADDVQTHIYDGTVKNVVASLNHNETNLVYSPQQGYTDVGTYEIEVSASETQNYLEVSKNVTLIIEEEMSTTEISDTYSVKIVPNPVHSGTVIQIHTDFPENELKNMKVRLFSMEGKLILTTQSHQKITEVKLPMGMTSATYILQVDTGKTIKNIPFIVK